MSLDQPKPAVQKAVHAGAKWYEDSKITGKTLVKSTGELLDDPKAEPLWARFYELETNRPFYSGRDGIKKYALTEIEKERRTGYAWLRPWGNSVLEHYKNWAKKYPEKAN